MNHVVLLGDSVFDNASYTRGEPDVLAHLRASLPDGWKASLLAVDGATTAGLPAQLRKVPQDATHVAVSVGGNDALGSIDLLDTPVSSTAEALLLFESRILRFEHDYRRAVEAVAALRRPTVVCTIYNGRLPDETEARKARMALMMFNDVIMRTAFELRLAVIDLRAVCSEPSDYANPIEPSGTGGEKIARAIVRAVKDGAPEGPSRVFTESAPIRP